MNVGGQYGFEDPDSWSDRNNEREPALSYMTEEREVVEKLLSVHGRRENKPRCLLPKKFAMRFSKRPGNTKRSFPPTRNYETNR